MDISKYKAEDFVLDPNFRKWVLKPGVSDNLYWERIFENFPYKSGEAAEARKIILNLSAKKFNLSDLDQKLLWEKIDKDLTSDQTINREKVIPLNPAGILKGRMENSTIQNQPRFLLLKVAVVALLVLSIVFLVPSFFSKTVQKEVESLAYVEKKSDPGIKIQLTLKDGSKVLLNSGSTLRYPQEFPDDSREIYLNGEALFEIANDSLRPFIVHSGDSKVIALGTSFTIDDILDERARELCGEDHRWTDLKRTGKLVERVLLYNERAIAANQLREFHLLRPIPHSQIERTTNNFPQNPGY